MTVPLRVPVAAVAQILILLWHLRRLISCRALRWTTDEKAALGDLTSDPQHGIVLLARLGAVLLAGLVMVNWRRSCPALKVVL